MTSASAASSIVLAKPLYTKVAVGALGVTLALTTAGVSGFSLRGHQGKDPIDFHAFYAASQLVWQGRIDEAYRIEGMVCALEEFTGKAARLPWSYPPPYDLLVAPLALLPVGSAYLLFVGGTLLAYLAALKRLSGPHFGAALLSVFPALIVTVSTGQNGFLSAALVGLACIGLLTGKPSAGVPLGLMIIKPHLIVGLAVHTLLAGRWATAIVATLIAVAASVIATALFGPSVWGAFLGGLAETRTFLESGLYPLFRMTSPYATLRASGASAVVAVTGQILAALVALILIWDAMRRKMPLPSQLGIAVIASLLATPYVYDYDLAIYGIGLALLLPDLLRLASRNEQVAIFGLSFFACAWGLVRTRALELQLVFQNVPDGYQSASPPSMAVLGFLILAWRILGRDGGGSVRARAIDGSHVGVLDSRLP